MIDQRISRLAIPLALSVLFPVLGAGQVTANPRAPMDDPRIGLKGGLYDAAEAAFGMEKLATLPKPPGFAPGNAFPTQPPPTAPGETPPPAASQFGSTNSDMAFSGNHL